MSKRLEKLSQQLNEDAKVEANLTAGIRMGDGGVEEFVRRIAAWQKYIGEIVPLKIEEIVQEKRPSPPKEAWQQPDTLNQYDVIVCGFGGAGSAAALDAADMGKKVLLIDRFDGGGSTRRSGGIYYAGGGTRAQKEAGVVSVLVERRLTSFYRRIPQKTCSTTSGRRTTGLWRSRLYGTSASSRQRPSTGWRTE